MFVSNRAGIKPVVMAVQTLGTTGTGSQTHLILARLDTKVSVFSNPAKYHPITSRVHEQATAKGRHLSNDVDLCVKRR